MLAPAFAVSLHHTLTEEALTMNLIQKWFEQIAGVSRVERDRWFLAQQVFGARRTDVSALHKPACWRRKAAADGLRR
jgi:hypothetical protein